MIDTPSFDRSGCRYGNDRSSVVDLHSQLRANGPWQEKFKGSEARKLGARRLVVSRGYSALKVRRDLSPGHRPGYAFAQLFRADSPIHLLTWSRSKTMTQNARLLIAACPRA
jgi:hypothetical protein